MNLECIESLTPTAQSITVALLSINKSLFPPLHITTKQFYICGCQQDNLRDCQHKEHFALLSTFLWLVEQKKYVFKQSLTWPWAAWSGQLFLPAVNIFIWKRSAQNNQLFNEH